jgi:hypothetical protein
MLACHRRPLYASDRSRFAPSRAFAAWLPVFSTLGAVSGIRLVI